MKKVIRLTERDLTRIVKRVIKENEREDYFYDPSDYDIKEVLNDYLEEIHYFLNDAGYPISKDASTDEVTEALYDVAETKFDEGDTNMSTDAYSYVRRLRNILEELEEEL